MTLTEKVAYLKGLMEGLEFDAESKDGKVIAMMADILEDMALAITELEDDVDDINEYMEAVDEDLTNVEEELFGECCDDCDDECCCCGEEDECFDEECASCLEAAPEEE